MRLLCCIIACLFTVTVVGQSVPNGGTITQGEVWTPAQWMAAWQSKVDVVNGVLNNPEITIGSGSFINIAGAGTVAATSVNGVSGGAIASQSAFNVLNYCSTPTSCYSSVDTTGAAFTAAMTENVMAAIANGQTEVTAPAGLFIWNATTGGALDITGNGLCFKGAGAGATVITVKAAGGTTGFLHFDSGTQNQCWGDFTLQETDNPMAGALILVDRANNITANNFTLSGGFNDLVLQSVTRATIDNFTLAGGNSTAGAAQLVFQRFSGSAANNSEIFMTNCDIRSSSGTAYTNAIVIHQVDGLTLGNCHPGFSRTNGAGVGSGSIMLVVPQYATDQLDNIVTPGTHLDGNGVSPIGLDFEPFAGSYIAKNLHDNFQGLQIEGVTGDCALFNDPSLTVVNVGGIFNGCGTNGIEVEGGTYFNFTGINFTKFSNTGAADGSAILLGSTAGTTQHIIIGDDTFGVSTNAPIAAISTAGTADYITLGVNDYGLTPRFVNGSSGTNNGPSSLMGFGSTATVTPPLGWTSFMITTSGTGQSTALSMTMPNFPGTTGWNCHAQDKDNPTFLIPQTGYTASSVSFTASTAPLSTDHVVVQCAPF